jgi:hypothetical protein
LLGWGSAEEGERRAEDDQPKKISAAPKTMSPPQPSGDGWLPST